MTELNPAVPPTPLLADNDLETSRMVETWGEGGDMNMFRALVVLMNLVVGVGLLGLPYCFRCGVILETIVVVFFGGASFFSFLFLIDASDTAGHPVDFAKLMGDSFTEKLEWIPHLVMFITFFGFGVVHLQAACSLFTSCLAEIGNVPAWLTNRWFLICIPGDLIGYPLILLKSLKAYSYVSIFTCGLIVLYVVHSAIYLVIYSVKNGFDPEKQISFGSFNHYFLSSLSIQAFAYACHPLIGPTLEKLKQPTKARQYRTMTILTLCASSCYGLGGLLPYLTLFDQIETPVVFVYYDKGQWFTILTKALYALFVVFTTPLILFSARLSLNDVIFKTSFTLLRYWTIGIILISACILMAVTVESLEKVFGLVGGVTCNIIVYILPAVYYIKMCHGQSKVKRVIAWIMAPTGFILIGVCLYAEVMTIVSGD
jgi:amino acid permease